MVHSVRDVGSLHLGISLFRFVHAQEECFVVFSGEHTREEGGHLAAASSNPSKAQYSRDASSNLSTALHEA